MRNEARLLKAAALISALLLTQLAFASGSFSVKLQSKTAASWDLYRQWADQKVQRELSEHGRFLIQDYLPPDRAAAVRRSLEQGGIVIERMNGVVPSGKELRLEEGTIHHWWGAVLIPNATLDRTLRFMQDYDHHAGRFADVEQSRVISRDGDRFKVYLRLRRSAALVTAYYNTEEDCAYVRMGSKRAYSTSNATKIAELANPGTPKEFEKPPGEDRGFLWRLVSWWRLQETDRGVIVEVESASLSRDIPTIVRFIPGVSSYINSIPKDSIRSILSSIRANVIGRQ